MKAFKRNLWSAESVKLWVGTKNCACRKNRRRTRPANEMPVNAWFYDHWQPCASKHMSSTLQFAHTVESGALAWFTWRCTKQNLHFIDMHVPCSIFHSCLSCCKNGFSYSAYIVNSVISVWLNLYSNCNWMYLKCVCSACVLGCGVGYDWLRRRWEFLPRLETPRWCSATGGHAWVTKL